MANSAASDIAYYLDSEGIGTLGQSIFIGNQPESKAICIMLYDVQGQEPNPRFRVEYPSIGAIIRSKPNDYQGAYNLAYTAREALIGQGGLEINDMHYSLITVVGDINFLGYDHKNRPEFSMTFRTIREPAEGNRLALT